MAWTIRNRMITPLAQSGGGDAGAGWYSYQWRFTGLPDVVALASNVANATTPDPPSVLEFLWPAACSNYWQGSTNGAESCGGTVWISPGNIKEIWLRYYFKYSSNWTWHPVANKHIYFENTNESGNTRLIFTLDGSGKCRMSTSVAYPNNYLSNTGNDPVVTKNVWHKVDMHIIFNDPGVANGSWQLYLDDAKIMDYASILINGPSDPMISTVAITPVWGGNSGAQKSGSDEYMWWDDITISDQGPIDGGPPIQDDTPPTTYGHSPAKSATGVLKTARTITLHMKDDQAGASGVLLSSIYMGVDINGGGYTYYSPGAGLTVTGTSSDYTLTREHPNDWANGDVVSIKIGGSDVAGNWMTEETYSFTIEAASALDVATTSLPDATIGAAYDEVLSAVGGTSPYTWSLQSGSLPSGWNLSSSGHITGDPLVAGTSTFTVRVTDNVSATSDQQLSITIVDASGYQEWTVEVDGEDILANSIIAGKIAAGAVGAEEIAANAIAVRHLVVGDYTNAVPNPMFQSGSGHHWGFSGVDITSRGGAGVPAGAPTPWVARIPYDCYALSPISIGSEWLDCTPGESYFASAMLASDSSVNSVCKVGVQWGTGSGSSISEIFGANVGSGASLPWTKFGGIVTAPSSACRFTFLCKAYGTAGKWYLSQPRIRKAGDGELIVDGAITAAKVGANEVIAQTANIKDAIITTLKIGTNAVTVPVWGFNDVEIEVNSNASAPSSLVAAAINAEGQAVAVNFSCLAEINSGGQAIFVAYRDGSQIAGLSSLPIGGGDIRWTTLPVAISIYDTPSSGTHNYEFRGYGSNSPTVIKPSLTLLGCKR